MTIRREGGLRIMKLEKIKTIAQLHGIEVNKLKEDELVRAIQRAKGNQQCFETGKSASCGQNACMWREICS